MQAISRLIRHSERGGGGGGAHTIFILGVFCTSPSPLPYQDGAISESHQRGGLPLALFCIALPPPSLLLWLTFWVPQDCGIELESPSSPPRHFISHPPFIPPSSSIPTRKAPAYTDSGRIRREDVPEKKT